MRREPRLGVKGGMNRSPLALAQEVDRDGINVHSGRPGPFGRPFSGRPVQRCTVDPLL